MGLTNHNWGEKGGGEGLVEMDLKAGGWCRGPVGAADRWVELRAAVFLLTVPYSSSLARWLAGSWKRVGSFCTVIVGVLQKTGLQKDWIGC